MSEDEFIQSIDAQMPYEDYERCISLIEDGASISDNASYMVLHELCRVPNDPGIDRKKLVALIELWKRNCNHELALLVSEIGIRILMGMDVSVATAMQAMDKISKFKGQHCALSIAYFSCNDIDGKVDAFYQEILEEWKNK